MQCVRPQVLQRLHCGQRLCRGCGVGDDDDNRQRQRRLERQTAATVGAAGGAAEAPDAEEAAGAACVSPRFPKMEKGGVDAVLAM